LIADIAWIKSILKWKTGTMNPVDIFSKVGTMAARRREGIPGTITVRKGPRKATAAPRGRMVRTE